jgi:hypothetical protein
MSAPSASKSRNSKQPGDCVDSMLKDEIIGLVHCQHLSPSYTSHHHHFFPSKYLGVLASIANIPEHYREKTAKEAAAADWSFKFLSQPSHPMYLSSLKLKLPLKRTSDDSTITFNRWVAGTLVAPGTTGRHLFAVGRNECTSVLESVHTIASPHRTHMYEIDSMIAKSDSQLVGPQFKILVEGQLVLDATKGRVVVIGPGTRRQAWCSRGTLTFRQFLRLCSRGRFWNGCA